MCPDLWGISGVLALFILPSPAAHRCCAPLPPAACCLQTVRYCPSFRASRFQNRSFKLNIPSWCLPLVTAAALGSSIASRVLAARGEDPHALLNHHVQQGQQAQRTQQGQQRDMDAWSVGSSGNSSGTESPRAARYRMVVEAGAAQDLKEGE